MNHELPIPTIPADLLNKLIGLNNKISIKIALCVFCDIMISEPDLCKICNVKPGKSVEGAYNNLHKLELVSRCVDDEHTVWYTVHPGVIQDCVQCAGCTHSRKKVYRSSKNAARYVACKSTVLCAHNYFRVAQAILKIYKAHSGLMRCAVDFRVGRKVAEEKAREYKSKEVGEWVVKDFVDMTLDFYAKYYPHLETPNRQSIRKSLVKIKKAFQTEFDNWEYLLKHYVIHSFKCATDDHAMVSLRRLQHVNEMQKYLETHAFAATIESCQKYMISCPYWKEDECRVIKGGGKCTRTMRSNIRRKYN